MIRFIIYLLVNGFAVWLASEWLEPHVVVDSYWTAIITGLVLGLVNSFVRPIITFLTLPITVMTFGVFLLLIQGAMVLLADWLVNGFRVESFGWAMLFTLLLAAINFVIGKVASPPQKNSAATL
ncbi:MAG: phage holin family protein [Bacteroidia bacterium]|nr:phage holin family protein [Bacteroidia bacterium]